MENVFTVDGSKSFIERINQLNPEMQPKWGKMSVDQMLAHCNVTYNSVYDDSYPKPNFLMKFMLKLLVKNMVVGPKPFKKNGQTAPTFLIKDRRDFEKEKKILIENIQKTQALGEEHFDGKESVSFGTLTKEEWNTLFAKHLDHHLTQFGV